VGLGLLCSVRGGANTKDVFDLVLPASLTQTVSGIIETTGAGSDVASVLASGSVLSVSFLSNATPGFVDDILQGVRFSNTTAVGGSSANLQFVFDDGGTFNNSVSELVHVGWCSGALLSSSFSLTTTSTTFTASPCIDLISAFFTGGSFIGNTVKLFGLGEGDSLGVSIFASSSVLSNSIKVDGYAPTATAVADGNDVIFIDIFASSNISGNSVSVVGRGGDDVIDVSLVARGDVSENIVTIIGGEGNDSISLYIEGSEISDDNILFVSDGGLLSSSVNTIDISLIADGSVLSNVLTVLGGAGVDSVTVKFSGSSRSVDDNVFYVDLKGNDDFLSVSLIAHFASITSNTFVLLGGSGDDTISVVLTASGSSSVDENVLSVLGGAGDDLLSLKAKATDIDTNTVSFEGGLGEDTIKVTMTATDGNFSDNTFFVDLGGTADSDSNTLMVDLKGEGFSSNTFSVLGGDGVDRIGITIMGTLETSIQSNIFSIEGYAGADLIDVKVFSGTDIADHTVFISGGAGNDTVSVLLSGTSAQLNSITVMGGGGDDLLDISLVATDDLHNENIISVEGGTGADTIDVLLFADGVSSNGVSIDGGTGADLVDVTLKAGVLVTSNSVVVLGGGDADVLSVSASAVTGDVFNNTFSVFGSGGG